MAKQSRKSGRGGQGGKGQGGQRQGGGSAKAPRKTRHAAHSGGPPEAKAAPSASPPAAVSTRVLALGIVLLAIAIVAALPLVVGGLGGPPPPGCGPESACAKAANSVFGHVPGVEWLKTSDLGFAYFLGVLIAFLATKGRLPNGLRWLVRIGAVASIGFLITMLAGGYMCAYCVAVHLANLAFVGVLEGSVRLPGSSRRGLVPAGGVSVVCVAVLAVLQARQLAEMREQDEAQRRESVANIVSGSQDPAPNGTVADPPDEPGAADPPPPPPAAPFTGRYRQGPESAPIRVVILSDYQCPDCRMIESEVRQLLATYDDMSYSHKHYPFCVDCNRSARARNFNPHPNACWSARAAETAAILGGEAGFWRMHHWLFDNKGTFEGPDLRAALPGLGFDDYRLFEATMRGPETERRVLEDVEEGINLGLYMTPMIFVNGVELKGWRGKNQALTRTIAEVAATNPPARTAAADRPPTALEKHLDDWREQPLRNIPDEENTWSIGAGDAAATVVIWGDYQEPFTKELDARLRAVVGSTPAVKYVFRHYPFDASCNPLMKDTRHPLACRAAQAAEAAGRLGGNEAYWTMHAWLMENQRRFSDAMLLDAAPSLGLDPAALFAEMESPDVSEAIRADARAGKSLGLRSIPMMYVNGRYLPRWRLDGERVPERVIEEAVETASTP